MPRLGEPVEPAAHAERVETWWRRVDAIERKPEAPQAPAGPTLPKGMPWPVD